MAQRVAFLRGVTGPFSPPCRWLDRDALVRELDAKLRRDLPLAPDLYLEALARLGLIGSDPPDLYERLLGFYSEQVLGYYEPSTDEMILVSNPAAAASSQELVWAHELEHAVQERRFGLPHRLIAMRSNGDAQRAASAVAEGDAMLVMVVEGSSQAGSDALGDAARALRRQAETAPVPPGLPRFFVADLVFPYTAGFDAVLAAYRQRGWAGDDALLRAPPGSTAALLHPDRSPPGPPIDDDRLAPVPPGWEQVLTDTLGEWALRFLLARRVGNDAAARLAAAWDADRLRLVRDRENLDRWALSWQLRCRTASGCRALEEALRRELPNLLSGLAGHEAPTRLDLRRKGRRTTWPAEPLRPPA